MPGTPMTATSAMPDAASRTGREKSSPIRRNGLVPGRASKYNASATTKSPKKTSRNW
jgi:hypothetical protein